MGSARSQQICRVSTLGALSMLETIRVITGSTRARHLTELHDGEIRRFYVVKGAVVISHRRR